VELLLIHIYVLAAVLAVLVLLFALYRFWFFFRNPERRIPEGNVVVAPADGWVTYVREIDDGQAPFSVKKGQRIELGELMDDPGGGYTLVIGIYMTPWSVHHNRIPFPGTVEKKVYRESRRNVSMLRALLNLVFRLEPYSEGLEYLVENERCTTVIRGPGLQGAVIQIADKWIRKIVNRCREGDRVARGETFGMIRMGSQCDLFLRIDGPYEITVRERDYVRAGSSILVGVRPRKT
jgi:phosphatidylserine decarboxylase